MSETAQELVDRILRDHEGYTGDGQGGDGALPVGDRSTSVRPIIKRDLREALIAPLSETFDARDVAIAARDKAEEWAQNPEDAAVEPGEFSALHWATKAAQWAGSVGNPVSYDPGQGLTPEQQGDARDNLGLGTAAVVDHGTASGQVPLNSDLGTMAVEDATDYVPQSAKASTLEARAGVNNTKWMTPARVLEAIEALGLMAGKTPVSFDNTARASNTWYQNTTGAPLYVVISGWVTSANDVVDLSPNATAVTTVARYGDREIAISVWVPSGWYIRRGSMAIGALRWTEYH